MNTSVCIQPPSVERANALSGLTTIPRPTAASLDLLDADEAELYRDLLDGTLGSSVRLEQERIAFAAIERALV